MRVNRLTGAGQGADAMTWQSWTNEAETVAAELLAELSPAVISGGTRTAHAPRRAAAAARLALVRR